MKRFLLPLVALCLLAPNVVAQEKEKPREPLVHKMANGLQIQVYDSANSNEMKTEIAEMPGIAIWKIRVSSRRKSPDVDLQLELHIPGKPAVRFGGNGIADLEKADCVYGFQPVEGHDLDSSPKTRIYNHLSYHVDGIRGDIPSDSRICENPFLSLGRPLIPRDPPVRADGTILLLQFSPSGKSDDPKNSELVVVVSLQDPPAK